MNLRQFCILWLLHSINAMEICVIVPLIDSMTTLSLINIACDSQHANASFVFLTSQDGEIDGCSNIGMIGIEAFANPEYWSNLNYTAEDMQVFLLRPFWKKEMMLGGLDVVAAHVHSANFVIADRSLATGHYSFLNPLLLAIPNPPLITSMSSAVNLLTVTSVSDFLTLLNSDVRSRTSKSSLLPPSDISHRASLRIPGAMLDSSSQYLSNLARMRVPDDQYKSMVAIASTYCNDHRMMEMFGSNGLTVIDSLRLTKNQNPFVDSIPELSKFSVEGQVCDDIKTEGKEARRKPLRLLCLAFTYEPRHESVRAALFTWARDCDGYLAVSNSTADTSLPTVTLQGSEGEGGGEGPGESYGSMSIKSRLIWTMVAQSQLIDEYDYFLLSGDDIYVFVDNLKAYLRYIELSSAYSTPIFVGRKMQQNALLRFYHGGSGYVMNRAAVSLLNHLFVTLPDACLTHVHTSMEDVMTARCLMHGGVHTFDAKDPVSGRHIFHPHRPDEAFQPRNKEFMQQVHSYETGEGCCSVYSASFQDMMPEQMQCLHHRVMTRQPANRCNEV